MFQFTKESTQSIKESPFAKMEIQYVQSWMIVICCIVYLMKELIPEIKDKLSYSISFLVKVVFSCLFLYSMVIHTPWKDVIENVIYAWMNKLVK